MLRKLNRREKYSIYAASGFIFLFFAVQFIFFPFVEKRANLERSLQGKREILKDMILLKSEYDDSRKKTELSKRRFAQREKDFTLFSFLDKLAGEAGVKNDIAYMKPSTSAPKGSQFTISLVEMKLQAITMEQLTSYLYMIETSKKMVFVKRTSITRKSRQAGFVDAVLQVETVKT